MDLRVTFHWKTAVRRTWRVLSECILTAVPSLKMKSEGVSTLLLKILDGILLFLLFCDAGEVYLHSSTESNSKCPSDEAFWVVVSPKRNLLYMNVGLESRKMAGSSDVHLWG